MRSTASKAVEHEHALALHGLVEIIRRRLVLRGLRGGSNAQAERDLDGVRVVGFELTRSLGENGGIVWVQEVRDRRVETLLRVDSASRNAGEQADQDLFLQGRDLAYPTKSCHAELRYWKSWPFRLSSMRSVCARIVSTA